jgi:hypothetical protein
MCGGPRLCNYSASVAKAFHQFFLPFFYVRGGASPRVDVHLVLGLVRAAFVDGEV